MGCGQSTVVQPPADAATIEFDRVLAEEKLEDELHFKLLCLGAGESGKSTIIKQLVFLHKQSVVSEEEKHAYVRVLHGNVLTCINTLIKESIDFGYQMTPEQKAQVAVIEAFDARQLLTAEVVEAIDALWTECAAIASTYDRRAEFWILEGCVYYFQHMHRFIEDDYSPTEEDIVAARKRTTGVVETSLKYGNVAWSVVDVGGQRSERRKWLNCFDNARGILYVVNLAGFCSVLFEDRAVNRMQESLKLFEETMANPVFADTPVFLILNKKDLFENLIETKPLTMAFPEYTGPQELRPCIEYIAAQFAARLPPAHSKPMVLLMAARVKKDVQYCFEDVKDTLIDSNRRGIKKATAKLESLREKYRDEQVREMESKARERQTAEGKQNQINREEQEKKHLAQLKQAQAEKNKQRSQANPNGPGAASSSSSAAPAASAPAAAAAAASDATGTTTTTAPLASSSSSSSFASAGVATPTTTTSSSSAGAASSAAAAAAAEQAREQPAQSAAAETAEKQSNEEAPIPNHTAAAAAVAQEGATDAAAAVEAQPAPAPAAVAAAH